MLSSASEPIIAIATAPGRGAVGMVRVSGKGLLPFVKSLVGRELKPREATYGPWRDAAGEPIDHGLSLWFPGPHSYTGEDVLELQGHGGPVVLQLLLARCLEVAAQGSLPGLRLARAGEFTERAFLNDKLDLAQAEAVADLIDARTSALQRQALAQLDGGLSRRLLALREAVLELEALIAYDVDFPEEDDGPIDRSRIAAAAGALRAQLSALVRTAPTGAMLRDGALVVLAGAPNAGKSSLFNALLGESRAIVTPIPGTTRDAIEAVLDRTPIPLRLVDTAGLRETDDALEQLGIEVSVRYLAQAQVVLACGVSPDEVAATITAVTPLTGAAVLPVLTKTDLLRVPAGDCSAVSAETGEGLAALLVQIDAAVGGAAPSASDEVLVTRERHRIGLEAALDEITAFEAAWRAGALPATVVAVHLHAARVALEELIGTVDVEDVLGRVFASFCIGK